MKSLTLAIGACMYKIKLKAMKTELTERQKEILNDNLLSLFFMSSYIFFAEKSWRNMLDFIPQLDDITADQLLDYKRSYLLRIRSIKSNSYTYVAIITEEKNGIDKTKVFYAVVTKNKQ